jgi:ABC-type multidrug transport system fused ATPase/permease subunit
VARIKKEKQQYTLGWIFSQTKGTRPALALFTVLTVAGAIIELTFAFFIREFINIATGISDGSLLRTGLLSIAFIAVFGLLMMINSVLSRYLYGKTERRLRSNLLNIIFTRRLADISKMHTGDLLTKLTVDTQAVSNCTPIIVTRMIGGLTSAVVATGLLFYLDWRMALIMLGLTPLLMAVMGFVTPRIQKQSAIDKENEESNRSIMQEYLSRTMLVKAYFMQPKATANVSANYAKKLKSGMKVGLWEGFAMFSGSVIGFSMFLVCLGVGAYFVMQGTTTFGDLVAIVQLLNYIVNPIANFAAAIAEVSQAKASAVRIGEICDLPSDVEITAAEPVAATALTAGGLSFSYNGESEGNVFEDVSVTFPKGSVTGIVGKSGCGKSTLLKLLIGLYEPKQGSVALKHAGGETGDILPQVAYVPPVDYLFSGTVTENIIMSERSPRISALAEAASQANILDFIESLQDGFDTQIGESGGTVSSGQAQRLAIARAIYKKSPIVVFDEPTANLDVESVEKFQAAVRQLAKDKIVIIVTHDISTITVCDRVYVIEEGRVRERIGNEIIITT